MIAPKDGRYFESAVASEGCIIQVKGYRDVPFAAEDVESVAITGKRWNFRQKKKEERSKASSASGLLLRIGKRTFAQGIPSGSGKFAPGPEAGQGPVLILIGRN